jgi:hypothetical protein
VNARCEELETFWLLQMQVLENHLNCWYNGQNTAILLEGWSDFVTKVMDAIERDSDGIASVAF